MSTRATPPKRATATASRPRAGRRPSGRGRARVVILLGSASDRPLIEGVPPLLERLGIAHRIEVCSAHRQPQRLRRLVRAAEREKVELFIAVAGMAAHLPGVVAALTARPVIGVPAASGPLAGIDALLSIVQMPPGVPVATMGIGAAGARNAAVLAARILALSDPEVAGRLEAYRRELAASGR